MTSYTSVLIKRRQDDQHGRHDRHDLRYRPICLWYPLKLLQVHCQSLHPGMIKSSSSRKGGMCDVDEWGMRQQTDCTSNFVWQWIALRDGLFLHAIAQIVQLGIMTKEMEASFGFWVHPRLRNSAICRHKSLIDHGQICRRPAWAWKKPLVPLK